ncbi:MAG: DUF2062 domain-containing protein [Desulfobacterales bacterium]|nr:DUF2062 domain-containing protein [Desulfobacterales bacterium]
MSEYPLRILIVIPVYNHGKTVLEVFNGCMALHPDVLVVDDGSADLPRNFASIIKEAGGHLIRHPENLGKGAALKTAAGFAGEEGFSHMITLDADLQHRPKDIPKFKAAVSKDPDALIVGKRDFSGPSIPNASIFGRQFSNFWFRVQTGHAAGDAQSGFRAYPVFVLDRLSLSQSRYDFEIEVLVKAAWAGVSVKSIDIGVDYPLGDKRVSHFNLFMDNLRLTHLNTLLTIRSFMPWPHKKIINRRPAPEFSIFRPMASIRHFLANEMSPFEIALSGTAGVILGTLPLIAMHSLAILIVTGFFRLNKVVALGTSQLCMPPIVPALCIEAGYFITHSEFLTEISIETLGYQAIDRFFEWCLGSLVVAPVLGGLVFILIYLAACTMAGTPEREEP